MSAASILSGSPASVAVTPYSTAVVATAAAGTTTFNTGVYGLVSPSSIVVASWSGASAAGTNGVLSVGVGAGTVVLYHNGATGAASAVLTIIKL